MIGAGRLQAHAFEQRVIHISQLKQFDVRQAGKETFKVGENAVRWDLTDVAPGLYFCRLERSGGAASVDLAKIVVVR